MQIILTHTNADFDAVASMLGAHKLFPAARPVLHDRQNRNVVEFLALYLNGLPFTSSADVNMKSVSGVILTDTQRLPEIRGLRRDLPLHIIDHHPPTRELHPHETWAGDTVGAATTLLVEQIQRQHIPLTSLEATLLMLGIYEDTGMLSYASTTPRDARAAAWLLEHNVALDTVRRFLFYPLTDEQQAVYDNLLKNTESRQVQGYAVAVCVAKSPDVVEGISSITHHLNNILDVAALFVLVEMPGNTQIVCRSAVEAINAGEVARLWGGGGHGRAAAASVYGRSLASLAGELWEHLYQHIRPVTRISELMSYGVQTVAPDRPLSEIIRHIRRIGHEGYPVVENGRVVGLLTRRDADRALEHGLGKLTVRDVMLSGEVTLRPDDSVSALEQRVVESGWGQIPVIDDDGRLIGIVTRTDLITHWARTHPTTTPVYPTIAPDKIAEVLGAGTAKLIENIARHAAENNRALYIVGGIVRDLLLGRPNLDIDFVVEAGAIHFVEALQARYGGRVHPYKPFGTAKWLLDEEVARSMGLEIQGLPDHIDFATSRNEFYEHPTALPTVYNSSIKLDLQRRDFTINALAVQLSPAGTMYRIIDFYGGMADLNARLIRVLHSLSFVDDPTRILRAARFALRLGFTIETRTTELIDTALPMLRRITGKRLQSELALLLREASPERGLLHLQALGVPTSIHPHFNISEAVVEHFRSLREQHPPWQQGPHSDLIPLYWHLLLIHIAPEELEAVCGRLHFGRALTASVIRAAQLAADGEVLQQRDARPSQIVRQLTGLPEQALTAAWHALRERPHIRYNLEAYMQTWRHMQPISTGETLKQAGLRPGPRYRLILDRLREAWLDGEIQTPQAEQELLQKLLQEGDDDSR